MWKLLINALPVLGGMYIFVFSLLFASRCMFWQGLPKKTGNKRNFNYVVSVTYCTWFILPSYVNS